MQNDQPTGNQFFQNVLILMSGSAFAQLIPVLVSPILTRLFAPESFALLAFYLSISNIFVLIATLRYEQAIMLPDNEEDAYSLLAISCLMTFAVAALCLILLVPWRTEIAELFGQDQYASWVMLVPLSVLISGCYRSMTSWVNRQQKYRLMASCKLIQTGTTASSNILSGLTSVTGGLVLGEIAGHFLALAALVRKTPRLFSRISTLSAKAILRIARKHQDFVKINTPHVLVDTLQSSGLILILLFFWGDQKLGLYALMLRVVTAPVHILGSSIAQVFYKEASSLYNADGDVHSLMKKVTMWLLLVSVPLFLIFMLVSPDLFQIIFGETWRESGEYARLLTPWFAAHFVVMPVMQLPIIYGKQYQAFLFGLVGNGIIIVTMIFGGAIQNMEAGFILVSFLMTLYFVALYIWISSICKR